MVKAIRRVPQPVSDHIHEFSLGNLYTLTPGVEVSLRGKRGRFRFQYARLNSEGIHDLTLCGGPLHGQKERFVSVRPGAITRIHRDQKTLTNIQRNRKGI